MDVSAQLRLERVHMQADRYLGIGLVIAIASSVAAGADPSEARRPNIVVILSDDHGYADVSFNPHHPEDVSTPHIDALADSGVVFTQGYVSSNVCSPTRAGLMTGRHPQRFGIYTAFDGGGGPPLNEVRIPQHLKPSGYASGAFGKWHMGLTPEYNPVNVGFDEFYGFMKRGAHSYFHLNDPKYPIYRGLEPIEDEGYLTDRITEEAVSFIERHRGRPFFLYVAYNAVHKPAEAPQESIQNQTGDGIRDTLMAMIKHLDNGGGRIVETLRREKILDDTLIFYLTDNGGAEGMRANNAPLRGYKRQNYEGGIRVPFVVSWPNRLEGGVTCDIPVWSLDILPTALAAAGLPMPRARPLDGRNILPALTGDTVRVHEHLFWGEGGKTGAWAVRSGKWKLVAIKEQRELFDLAADPWESNDLADRHPDKVDELSKLYDAWLDTMAEPVSGQPKRWSDKAVPRGGETKEPEQSTAPAISDNGWQIAHPANREGTGNRGRS
jgi:arylsulfatase A-like enzyme